MTLRRLGPALMLCLCTCRSSPPTQEPLVTGFRTAEGFPSRLVYTLTHLDGRALPRAYSDPRGNYTLVAGELTLEADDRILLVLDLEATREFASGPPGRRTLAVTYTRVGTDSLYFPADSVTGAPEFFGRLRAAELIIDASPTRRSDVPSLAREYGGIHRWRFVRRQ